MQIADHTAFRGDRNCISRHWAILFPH